MQIEKFAGYRAARAGEFLDHHTRLTPPIVPTENSRGTPCPSILPRLPAVHADDKLMRVVEVQRDSVMLDWSPSEFSRWRLQLSNDRAREGVTDRQLFLQYQVNLGAHGAHSY